MADFEDSLRERPANNEARERAITAFLGLGERLKSLTGRDRRAAADGHFVGASALFDTIEGEIIPRLMLAHRIRAAQKAAIPSNPTITEADHDAFLQCVLEHSATSARRFVDDLAARGVPRDDLLLDLLATAARRLGVMWEEDRCDFSDVTIGLCRLHEIVRHSSNNGRAFEPVGSGPRILLATACGDQHVFGVIVVADFFRRAGWRVTSEPGATQARLADILGEREFDMLGISAACSAVENELAGEIRALRAASRNPRLKILAGGRLFSDTPGLAEKVGADAHVNDPAAAAEVGEKLLAANAARC